MEEGDAPPPMDVRALSDESPSLSAPAAPLPDDVNLSLLENKEVVANDSPPDQLSAMMDHDKPPKKRKRKDRDETSDEEEEQKPVKRRSKQLGRMENLFLLDQTRRRFPKAFKEVIGKRKLHKMSDEELEIALSEIRFSIGATNSLIINEWVMQLMNRGVETALVGFGVKCKGMAVMCEKDPEFTAIYDELSLEFMHITMINPRWKMGLYYLKQAYLLDSQRRKEEDMERRVREADAQRAASQAAIPAGVVPITTTSIAPNPNPNTIPNMETVEPTQSGPSVFARDPVDVERIYCNDEDFVPSDDDSDSSQAEEAEEDEEEEEYEKEKE